jgi:hypothetical protein
MENRGLKVRDLGDVVFWGPNLAKVCRMFDYGVGNSVVVGIEKSQVGCKMQLKCIMKCLCSFLAKFCPNLPPRAKSLSFSSDFLIFLIFPLLVSATLK